jgi:hypothetical protein
MSRKKCSWKKNICGGKLNPTADLEGIRKAGDRGTYLIGFLAHFSKNLPLKLPGVPHLSTF